MATQQLLRLGGWIKEARAHGRLTQEELAGRVARGVSFDKSQPWFSAVERGEAEPSRRELLVIALALDADPVEALELGGYLGTPAWARRVEDKIDRVARSVEKVERQGRAPRQ
jgi:transcriptional regulator with XRE-family HTH domain